uniref:Histidine kinase n=1 Tax=Ganoderma boninense TaxID=34458 RepID=A0A5K1JYI6_9APHY|nr:Histidine kinase [Ganoderma boninense]
MPGEALSGERLLDLLAIDQSRKHPPLQLLEPRKAVYDTPPDGHRQSFNEARTAIRGPEAERPRIGKHNVTSSSLPGLNVAGQAVPCTLEAAYIGNAAYRAHPLVEVAQAVMPAVDHEGREGRSLEEVRELAQRAFQAEHDSQASTSGQRYRAAGDGGTFVPRCARR